MKLVEGGHGLGDPTPEKSLECWKCSSEAGHGHSLWNSGIFYFNGFGTRQDIIKGIEMIQKGMKISTDLKLPPQLSDMNQSQIDILIKIVSKSDNIDHTVEIDQLDQLIKVSKDPRVIGMNSRIFQVLSDITLKYMSENQLNAEKVVVLALKRSSTRHVAVDTRQFSLASSPAIWIGTPIVLFGLYTLAKSRKWI